MKLGLSHQSPNLNISYQAPRNCRTDYCVGRGQTFRSAQLTVFERHGKKIGEKQVYLEENVTRQRIPFNVLICGLLNDPLYISYCRGWSGVIGE